jgi:microcystin-dependent protein
VTALKAITWSEFNSDPNVLLCALALDFSVSSTYTVRPLAPFGVLGEMSATGVVIDNTSGPNFVTVTIGQFSAPVPPFTQSKITLGSRSPDVQISGSGSVPATATFFRGQFPGDTPSNNYGSQVAAILASITGQIIMWGGSVVPSGYLACDGSAVSRATYSNLFGIIGTVWGVGDGSTTFNVPDLRGRSPLGAGPSDALGATGGARTVTLATAEIPAHTHTITDTGHNHTQNAHSHTLTDPGHAHLITDPGHTHTQNAHNHTLNDPGHTHTVFGSDQNTTGGSPFSPFEAYTNQNRQNASGSAVTGISLQAATATNISNSTGISINSNTTGITEAAATATNNSATTGISVNNAGGGGAHNNLHPYAAVSFLIKT